MKPLALKWRISLAGAGTLVAIIATISATAYQELRESLLRHIDGTLRMTAEAALSELAFELGDSKELRVAERDVRAILAGPSDRRPTYYRVWLDGQRGDLVAHVPPSAQGGQRLREPPAERLPRPGEPTFFSAELQAEEYRVVWMRGSTPRGDANVLVARSTRRVRHEMGELLQMLLILGSGVAAGSIAVGALIVVWALRPIDRTADRLRRVTERNLGVDHLSDLKVPRELEAFRRAVEELLRRLHKAMQHQKQFTADASHELRTPLAVAKSTLQVARTRDRDLDGYKRAIDEALEDLGRMERLIHQLLALARMKEGEALAGPADLRLDELLRGLAQTLDARASQTGGKVVCETMPAVGVRGEKELLRQLFDNLLDNAIAYGPRGGTVRIALSDGSQTDCTVTIHDEGGHIPAESLDRLFDRFYRADSSRSRATGGAGLGLAIAREIARRHGGDIDITSDPARGTVVRVRLPRR